MVLNPTYMPVPRQEKYTSFKQFYPPVMWRADALSKLSFTLQLSDKGTTAALEHSKKGTRRLHLLGTTAALGLLLAAAVKRQPSLLLAVPLAGYGCAWIGHFGIEKNRPATFKHPIYSLLGDFKLWWEVVTLQRAF